MRVLVGAFGDPGHTFPAIALAKALRERGHEVCLQSWARWRPEVEAEGIEFAEAPEYHVFPTRERPLKPYEAVVRATADTRPLVRAFAPDVVVADILTLAPALAAELEGVRSVTLIPHVDPRPAPGFAPYSVGARLPRTALGRRMWGPTNRLMEKGLAYGREELNETRARLGLLPLAHVHGGISRELCLVGTFPQLEYPRPEASAPNTHVVGPLQWEPPTEQVELPPGDAPLVLVAPSTSQDPRHALLRAALAGLADAPVRVLAATNRRRPIPAVAVPANARLVDWVSYSRTMPHCDVVVCHGGHGTVLRALTAGSVPVIAPAAGDMNENAARVDWAGVGVRIPRRLLGPRAMRLAVERALGETPLREHARALAEWAAANPAGPRAAALLEAYHARSSS
ncbi:MAG: glycosyltransferase [Solirubrobacterales bacterium]|nr:glycosyltransferase [Solirubrobacterales bacterium]